jgi:hypothetical protein
MKGNSYKREVAKQSQFITYNEDKAKRLALIKIKNTKNQVPRNIVKKDDKIPLTDIEHTYYY